MHVKRILPIFVCTFSLFAYGLTTNERNIAAQPTSTQADTVSSTAQVPRLPIFTGQSSVTFVDAQHGWMIAGYALNNDIQVTIDATTDGGQTWQALTVLCSGVVPNCIPVSLSGRVSELHFANTRNGWAFGPDFFSTRDGGRTWKKETLGEAIWALEVTGETLWALQGPCTDSEPIRCRMKVIVSKDNGQTWRSSTPVVEMTPVRFLASDSQTALLLYHAIDDQGIAAGKPHIIATYDGGHTWQAVSFPDPCDGDWNTLDLAAVDRQNLWFACGTHGAGPWGAKRVLTSSDGGRTWQLKAKVDLPEEPGYNITSYGYLRHIYAFSSQSAWMTLGRSSPIVTRDGGQSWQSLQNLQRISAGVDELGWDKRLIWVDSRHVWYYSLTFLFSTRDEGLTWVCQRAAVGYSFGTGCSE